MRAVLWGLTIGISIGVMIGFLLITAFFFCIRLRKRHSQIGNSSSMKNSTIPVPTNGTDSSTRLTDSTTSLGSPKFHEAHVSLWLQGKKRKSITSMSGIPKYSYKDLQKATTNFTTVIGEGAFGPVYKAQMPTGETVAVKVLAANSKQGEKEFQTEVLLLGRLHHRNLVNLVGYCAEKGHHMLIYVYMHNGSLASHLYNLDYEPLCWDMRIYITLHVARGIEYLHNGAIPPIIHRDIKSSNILLDQSMRARVADFGLSREDTVDTHVSSMRGTFGYLDPEYISTRIFTKKSDVYSFGVLLFELITGRNPQKGLMEYVELAALGCEGRVGWEEIVDSRLDGNYNSQELNDMASLAYKCINKVPGKRPSIRDIVQALSHWPSRRRHDQDSLPISMDEELTDLESQDNHICLSADHQDEITDLESKDIHV